jgi:hypothetical protein
MMRKEYDFSKGVKNRHAVRLSKRVRRPVEVPPHDPPDLTRSQTRELDRRLADLRDRTRYLLVSRFGPRFALYYNVSEDTYGMNEPAHATLFKRRQAAAAVKRLLGRGIDLIRCRVDRRGKLVLRSVSSPKRRPGKRRKGAA